MRVALALISGKSEVIILDSKNNYSLASSLFGGETFSDCKDLIERYSAKEITAIAKKQLGNHSLPAGTKFLPPYAKPEMIWGIGLNYVDHAADLSAQAPSDEPASFIKGRHTIIGSQDEIILPEQSKRTTAEAELGIVIGKATRNIEVEEAMESIFGVVPVLDQTAEDILQKNPRFLTRSKNFPSFYSFGPWIVTIDEVIEHFGSLANIKVATYINDQLHRENRVANMTFPPEYLISFHSKVFELVPGDMISTGTPGAIVISDGDRVECRIEGIGTLTNTVKGGTPEKKGATS